MGNCVRSSFEYMGYRTPLVSRGADISKRPSGSIELSQKSFREKIFPPQLGEVEVNSKCIPTHNGVKRRLGASIVECIQLFRTRFDVIFGMCLLASDIPTSMLSVSSLAEYVRDTGELSRPVHDGRHPLMYHPMQRRAKRPRNWLSLPTHRSMRSGEGGPIEARCMIYADPFRQNGPGGCFGNSAPRHARRIFRVCRSSAHAGSITRQNACDFTVCAQCVLSEVFFGGDAFKFLQEAGGFPSISPFAPRHRRRAFALNYRPILRVEFQLKNIWILRFPTPRGMGQFYKVIANPAW